MLIQSRNKCLNAIQIQKQVLKIYTYSETCLSRTLSKSDTCRIQTDFTVTSTKCLCNLNLCKANTCINWTHSSVPKKDSVCFTIHLFDLSFIKLYYSGYVNLTFWYFYSVVNYLQVKNLIIFLFYEGRIYLEFTVIDIRPAKSRYINSI